MESGKYWEKIKNWHKKAEEVEDFFIKFILEYISFIVFLYNINPGINQDRQLIQNLKKYEILKNEYLDQVDECIIKKLKKELELNPIKNVTNRDDRWWDCDANNRLIEISQNDGKLRSLNDFTNIVEFIYRARNNLFHGHKGLNYERDLTIVKFGYRLLNPLMKIILKQEDFNLFLLIDENIKIRLKKYQCLHCMKKFTTRRGLHQHISAKHPEKQKDKHKGKQSNKDNFKRKDN